MASSTPASIEHDIDVRLHSLHVYPIKSCTGITLDEALLIETGLEFDFRWEKKPGLTGLAQIVGTRAPQDALELDRSYTARWNPLLDCQLIALSFAVNLFGKSRVQRRLRRWTLARAK